MANEGMAPRFLCDAMLGRLCKWLRLLGNDCRYADLPDDDLVVQARAEGRVLLTRDTGLVRRRDVGRHLFIRHDHVEEQIKQVAEAFGIDIAAGVGTRCMRCNALLEALTREAAAGRVPPHVWRTQQDFSCCPSCGRIYWPGTHWDRMAEKLSDISAAGGQAADPPQGRRASGGPATRPAGKPRPAPCA